MASTPDESLRAEIGRVWHLAWPVALGMLALMGMGTVDTLVVSRLGRDAMASMALATTWFYSVAVLGFGTIRALDPVVAQAYGAGDRVAVGRAFVNGFALCALLVPFLVAAALAGPIALRLLGQPVALLGLTGTYLKVLATAVPGMLAFSTLRQMLQSVGSVRPATATLVAVNLINAAIGITFVYGLHFGAVGVAFATTISHWASFGILLWLARDRLREILPTARIPDGPAVRELVRLGVPLGVQMGMESWAFSTAGMMMGWIGPTALAAHALVLNCATLSFMIPLGISTAAATRVGHLLGSGAPWRGAAAASLLLGGGVMMASGLVYSLLPRYVVALYHPEAAVFDIAVALLPIVGAFQLFDGLQVVAFGVLRGAGDLRVPTLANLLGYWAIGLPLGWFLAFRAGLGPFGVWSGIGVGLFLVATLLLLRVRATMAAGGRRIAVG